MTTELHCSACDAVLPAAAQKCPGCGLRLMAQAAPAVYVEGPRFSVWKIVLLAVVAFVVIVNILERIR